jgi:hypothetical protein
MYQNSHGLLGSVNGNYPNTEKPLKFDRDVVTRPYVKEHVINLKSVDRQAGSSLTSAQIFLTKPVEITGHRAVIYLDSFIIDRDAANVAVEGIIDDNIFEVHIPEISQPLSYSSTTKGISDILLSWRGHIHQNQNGGGLMPIVDKSLFTSKMLTVNITSLGGGEIAGWTQDWNLVLVVREEIYE